MVKNAVFEVAGLCRSYGSLQALHPVSFRLQSGMGLALTGDNGSGKSTLMRLLAGIESPDTGNIFFCGKKVLGNRKFLRREVGYVPQELSLDDNLTVASQLSLWQAACGCSANAEAEAAMGLSFLRKKRISELSGGQARRVSIVLALMNNPTLLLLDEAFAGLDAAYTEILYSVLSKHLRMGGILIMVTHNSEEAAKLCSVGLKLHEGQVLL